MKPHLVFLSFFVLSLSTIAQEKNDSLLVLENDSLNWQILNEVLASSQRLLQTVEDLQQQNKSLSDNITEIAKANKELRSKSTYQGEQLNKLLTSSKKDAEQQYLIIKENINSSARAFTLSSNIIEKLDLGIQNKIESARHNLLSSPESGVVGFKLSHKIEEFSRKVFVNESQFTKFMGTVNSITKSDLVQNITPAPALGIANAVINLLHGISFENKKINTKAIEEFEKQFTPYVMYYEKLSKADNRIIEANTNLLTQLDNVNMEIINLFATLMEYEEFRKDLKINYVERKSGQSKIDFLKENAKMYHEIKINNFFNQLEQEYKIGNTYRFEDILNDKKYFKSVNNLMDKMIQYSYLLNFIEKEYFSAYDAYIKAKLEALDIVPTIENTNQKTIKNIKADVRKNGDILAKKERKSIDINTLINEVENSRFTIKLI